MSINRGDDDDLLIVAVTVRDVQKQISSKFLKSFAILLEEEIQI
jgi:hypothetical protein